MPTTRVMQTVSRLIPQGRDLAGAVLRRATHVELDWDVRQKSRFDATTADGTALGVFLPRGTVVRGGDVLVTSAGALVRVVAAPQPVLRIRACELPHLGADHDHPPAHDAAFDLMRAAYHLGNRHVPIELRVDHLKIEPDHVLAALLRSMHLTVTEVNEPFEPEAGAYAHGHLQNHPHTHPHGDGAHEHG